MTRATTSERRIARNARFTDKASVVLPAEATVVLFLIPAVSIRWNFYRKKIKKIIIMMNQIPKAYQSGIVQNIYIHKPAKDRENIITN
jgi:hypothetical protein